MAFTARTRVHLDIGSGVFNEFRVPKPEDRAIPEGARRGLNDRPADVKRVALDSVRHHLSRFSIENPFSSRREGKCKYDEHGHACGQPDLVRWVDHATKDRDPCGNQSERTTQRKRREPNPTERTRAPKGRSLPRSRLES